MMQQSIALGNMPYQTNLGPQHFWLSQPRSKETAIYQHTTTDQIVVQQHVKQVMGDLITVLAELRTVVGDIKTLVSQIDVVTHKIDESVSSGDSEEKSVKVTEDKVTDIAKEKTTDHIEDVNSCHSKENSENSSVYESLSLDSSRESKTRHQIRSQRTEVIYQNINDFHDLDNFNKKCKQRKDKNGNNVMKNKKNRQSMSSNDYVNINMLVLENRQTHQYNSSQKRTPSSDTKPKINSKRLTDKKSSGLKRQKHVTDNISQSLNCQSSQDSSTDTVNQMPNSPVMEYSGIYEKDLEESLTSSGSTDYSGLYEREMEDCLELEISESLDILDTVTDVGSVVSIGHEEQPSQDWHRQEQVDIVRKRAEVVAWTRASWAGQNYNHSTSFEQSVSCSEDQVTDGEQDTEADIGYEEWKRILPTTTNQHIVNFSWRTVIEP